MASIQRPVLVTESYECHLCVNDPVNPPKIYNVAGKLINHLYNAHKIQLQPRETRWRRDKYSPDYRFIKSSDVRRLCCPSCGFHTEINNHAEMEQHYIHQNHIINRIVPDQPPAADIQQNVPSQRAASPIQLRPHRQRAVDMTGWDLTHIPNRLSQKMWEHTARHGDPNFVRRSRQWWTDIANMAIRNRQERLGYDDDAVFEF